MGHSLESPAAIRGTAATMRCECTVLDLVVRFLFRFDLEVTHHRFLQDIPPLSLEASPFPEERLPERYLGQTNAHVMSRHSVRHSVLSASISSPLRGSHLMHLELLNTSRLPLDQPTWVCTHPTSECMQYGTYVIQGLKCVESWLHWTSVSTVTQHSATMDCPQYYWG